MGPETRGVCLSEEQTVSSRRPRTGAGYRVRTEPYKSTCQYEVRVTAILILYGLPRLLTGTILAHEMMHAWFRLHDDFRNLRQEVEEGMCQVIAGMWLESQIKSMSDGNNASNSSWLKKPTRSPFEEKLGGFYKNQIETDTSEVYGDGFRAGRRAVAKFGLRRTFDHMWRTQNFPH
ncbi:Protein da1 [Orobanche gracilis]